MTRSFLQVRVSLLLVLGGLAMSSCGARPTADPDPDEQISDAARPRANADDAAMRVSLQALVDDFFVPTCVLGRCHTTLAPAGGLSLTNRTARVFETLVNAPSSQAPRRARVVPFDPDASYLIEKLTSDAPSSGTRMPPPLAVLSPAQVARVRAWISQGALDN